MAELINDRFIQDLGTLLGSATGDAKTQKSFYEIGKEFELMTKTIEKKLVCFSVGIMDASRSASPSGGRSTL